MTSTTQIGTTPAAQAAFDDFATKAASWMLTPYIVTAVEFEGRVAVAVAYTYESNNWQTGETQTFARRTLLLDGRQATCPTGDAKALAKKVLALLERDAAEAALLPRLQSVLGRANGEAVQVTTTSDLGDVRYVYAMGYLRRGIVTHITKTGRVEVTYVSESAPTNVHRKVASVVYTD